MNDDIDVCDKEDINRKVMMMIMMTMMMIVVMKWSKKKEIGKAMC